MIKKLLTYITDYNSGRFMITSLILVIVWCINVIQLGILIFNGDEYITKVFFIKLIGLILPFNLITVWF